MMSRLVGIRAALLRWVSSHPRLVLWLIVIALLPYITICWGVALTVGSALAGGGCGG